MYPVPRLFHPPYLRLRGNTCHVPLLFFPNITTGLNHVNACGGFYTGMLILSLPRK